MSFTTEDNNAAEGSDVAFPTIATEKNLPAIANHDNSLNLDDLSFYPVKSAVAPTPAASHPSSPPSSSTSSPYQKQKKMKAIEPVITSYGYESNYQNVNTGVSNGTSNFNNPFSYNFGGRNNNPLPTLVKRMRIINISFSIAAIIFEIPLIAFKLFTPTKMVLASYLGFMSILLLGFELHTPVVRKFLIDNFGILYSPVGRSLFIILMGILAMGQASILEILLGILLFGNGIFTLAVNCIFPEFKKVHESPEQREDMLEKVKEYGIKHNWVDTTGSYEKIGETRKNWTDTAGAYEEVGETRGEVSNLVNDNSKKGYGGNVYDL